MTSDNRFPDGASHWKSAIANVQPGAIRVRGYELPDLIGRLSFTEIIWLVTVGELPTKQAARVLDAVLVSAAEGGAQSQSVLAARTVASAGAPVTVAMAAGALAISKYHGGAVEGAMRQLLGIRAEVDAGALPAGEACRQAVRARLAQRERLEGFGHRVHKTRDPRVEKLFQVTREAGFGGVYLELGTLIEQAIEAETRKRLPMNVDGAYAAILCEIGFPPELSNALFLLSRSVGIMAHAREEQARMRPRRYIHPTDWEYDGPPSRGIGDRG